MRAGYCIFQGRVVEQLNYIKTETICQQACQHIPFCKYYIWDSSTQDCKLLDSAERPCDLVRLPVGAEVKSYDLERHLCEDLP